MIKNMEFKPDSHKLDGTQKPLGDPIWVVHVTHSVFYLACFALLEIRG